MALPPPPMMVAPIGSLNPIESLIMNLNTNTYLIGTSMILLNLGGRHLAMGLTPEQDRFFQAPWMRRTMLFVVIFVATRNVFTALWLSLGLILFIGYLLNEQSVLYLFGEPVPAPPAPPPPAPIVAGLTGEEQEIYKRLHDKVHRMKSTEELHRAEGQKKDSMNDQLVGWYKQNMAAMRGLLM